MYIPKSINIHTGISKCDSCMQFKLYTEHISRGLKWSYRMTWANIAAHDRRHYTNTFPYYSVYFNFTDIHHHGVLIDKTAGNGLAPNMR